MGNSSSKSKSKKQQKSRKIVATATNNNINAQPFPQTTITPDYRKPQPEQSQNQQHEEYYYHDQDQEQDGHDDYNVDTSKNSEHANIDSCIERLIASAQHKHIGKTLCLNQTEVIAICRYAYNIFLDQPVSLIIYKYMIIFNNIHSSTCIDFT
jgi:hypothetical protein